MAMRRLAVVLLAIGILIGLATLAPQAARAGDDGPVTAVPPVTILAPEEGTTVSAWGEFEVVWTRFPDVLWYNVQVYVPSPEVIPPDRNGLLDFDDGLGTLYRSFRYEPDQYLDVRRHNPRMKIDATLLQSGYPARLVITPMGPTEALIAEYGERNPPTGLAMSWYVPLSPPSAPRTIFVERP
jgi:hypothetical protein